MEKKNLFKAEIIRIGKDRFGFDYDEKSIEELSFQLKQRKFYIYSGESSVGKVIRTEDYDDHISVLFSTYFSPPIVPIYLSILFKMVTTINQPIPDAIPDELLGFEINRLVLSTDRSYPSQPPILFIGHVIEVKNDGGEKI